jgi:hypothetical protein
LQTGPPTGDATCSSKLPLTLGELTDFFLGAWDLIGVLDMNFESDRYPPEQVRAFFEASSEFYPDLVKLVEQRMESWLQEKRAEFDEDAEENDDDDVEDDPEAK